MARLCERPGCSDRAEVAYGFDALHLVVWLDAFHVAQGARSGVLCRRHANAMVVPMGWMLDDRRDPEPRLFRAPPTPPVAEAAPLRRRRAATAPKVEQLQLDTIEPPAAATADSVEAATLPPDVELALDSVAAADVPSLEEPAAPWVPQFDQHDDLEGLLNARGRLLSRAFNGLGSSADH